MANFDDLILPPNTRANQPAAGIAGRIYFVTDEGVVERDNGITWEDYSPPAGLTNKHATMWHYDSIVTVGNALITTIDGGQFLGYYVNQNASANGDTTTNGFVIQAGTYTLKIFSYINTNLGKVDFYIDNVQVGTTLDFYNGSLVYNTTKSITGIVMTEGYHTLKTVVNGKNAAASTYNFPVTTFKVVPSAY